MAAPLPPLNASRCRYRPASDANAQRSGIIPRRSASSSAASATRREPSRSPAQHNAAASTTSDFTVCRAEPNAAGQRRRPRRRGPPPPHPDRGPSPVQRTPRPSARAAAQAPARRSGRRRGCSARSDAANRPMPSASAASPISASAPASGSAPASADARPSQPRARSCQPSWRRNDARVLWASDTNGPRGPRRTRREIGQRAAVAALAAGDDGPQPQFMRGRRGGQRPAPGSSPNAAFDRSAVEVIIGVATLSTRNGRPGTGGYRDSIVVVEITLVNSWCCQC